MRNGFIIVMLLMSMSAYAQGDYYSEHEKGWHWYDDPKYQAPSSYEGKLNEGSHSHQAVLEARRAIQDAKDELVIHPSIENAEHYIKLQNELSERAELVSQVWKQTMLRAPELDYLLKHPVNQVGLQVDQDEKSKAQEEMLRDFGHHAGFFFFFKSTCPYCHRFSPILKDFSTRYGINIIPISMDGISLPEFPEARTDQGQAAQFHVGAFPAVFAVNPKSGKAYPVAYGLVSEAELRDNLYNIITHYQGGA